MGEGVAELFGGVELLSGEKRQVWRAGRRKWGCSGGVRVGLLTAFPVQFSSMGHRRLGYAGLYDQSSPAPKASLELPPVRQYVRQWGQKEGRPWHSREGCILRPGGRNPVM